MVVGHPESYFTLMNQDIPLLEFSCQRNSFDEPAFFELQWRSPLRPIGYRGLPSFLEKRRAPQQRKNIQQLMAQYGCEDMEGFIRISHALSLNDTFWIREANSLLRWKDVSPYTNRFSESISHTAFDGSLGETDLSTMSPEFCTGGRYAKCWLRQGDRVYLYKRGSTRHKVEPLSEYLAAQLASELCPDAVHYDLGYHRGELICRCPLFTSETVGYTSAGAIFPKYERTIGGHFVRKFLPKLLWNQPNVIELQEFSTYRRTISWKYHYLSLWAEPIIERAIIFYLIYSHLKAFLLVSGVSDGNTT